MARAACRTPIDCSVRCLRPLPNCSRCIAPDRYGCRPPIILLVDLIFRALQYQASTPRGRPMFRESQALSELVGDIYDTTLERGSWPSVLEKSAEFVGGSAAAIFSRNQATADGCVYHQFGVDPQDQERLFSTFAELDPAMAESCLAEIGQFVAISDFMPYREIGQTFMNHEQAWPQGLVYRLTTPRDKRATGSALFGVFRHGEGASVDDEMRWRADLIVPHIRRAVLIGNVLESKQAEAASYSDLLHGLAGGVFLVDRDCRLAFANTTGQAMLEDGQILHVESDTLVATDPQVL